MTDAEYKALKEKVQTLFDKWIAPLGLKWWDITIEYIRDSIRQGQGVVKDDLSQSCLTCRATWQYSTAHIAVYLQTIEYMTDEALESAVVHELMHIFLNETRQDGEDWLDHEERVATTLAKAFIWLRDSIVEPK